MSITIPEDPVERQKLVDEIERRVEVRAKNLEYDAGMGGEWGDRGAGELRDALRIWQDGLAGRVPKELAGIARSIIKENHPDYPAYLRLKEEMARLGAKIGIDE